ncbi:MAG: sugar kinase [Cyanobacteria bacterium P01_A01_bin.40]
MQYRGLFVGLVTLDMIYLSDHSLAKNHKIVAQDYLTVGGGPATNAAVTFNYLGNQSQLITVLGQHPLSQLIRNDLAQYSVEIVDLIPQKTEPPVISSIIVTSTTGERAVISINAVKSQVENLSFPDLLKETDIVLVDGHQLPISLAIAKIAQARQIPLVMDGGSWKPGLEVILPVIDYAICSANFYPPQCKSTDDVFHFLQEQGISQIAITNGANPIQYLTKGKRLTLPIPPIKTVDTLGAGDIFHGAFCHYILQSDFASALNMSAEIASKSCMSFGTRNWLK